MAQTGESERIVKLMLFIRENGPVDYAGIRAGLPFEYGSETGIDESVRRRFERDKRTLQNFGIFLNTDSSSRYSLDTTRCFAAPIDLTKSQASLLRLLCGALLEDRDYPLKDDLRMVLVKLGDELGVPDLLPQMERPSLTMPKTQAEPQGLAKIRKAIGLRKRLHFEYRTADGKESTREVEPFGCFMINSNCYTAAFDLALHDERLFRLDRMRRIRVNAAAPDIPDFEERPFDAGDYYGLPFQFGNENYLARIRFDESEAWRCERICLGQGDFEDEGGSIVWAVECRDTESLARWCIEHAPGVEIIDPPYAAEAMKRGLACALRAIEESMTAVKEAGT